MLGFSCCAGQGLRGLPPTLSVGDCCNRHALLSSQCLCCSADDKLLWCLTYSVCVLVCQSCQSCSTSNTTHLEVPLRMLGGPLIPVRLIQGQWIDCKVPPNGWVHMLHISAAQHGLLLLVLLLIKFTAWWVAGGSILSRRPQCRHHA